jgi:YegS/Rv2252/BmrU family lipid kinase
MKEKIVFIVNPISGGKNKGKFTEWVNQYLNADKYDSQIFFTEKPGHACKLTVDALNNGVKKIIAVGGDGTVNEVARELVGSEACLGIIPFGSGNGLARHMGIPIDPKKAIQHLNTCGSKKNDAGKINNMPFFCTSGVGFDAHIGKIFATLKGRGFSGYIKAVLGEFATYKAQEYTFTSETGTVQDKAFLITFANASQYGNNAYIAPQADIHDGKLDICILKPFPFYAVGGLALRVFNKTANKSAYMKTFTSNKIEVKRAASGPIHLDGEPYEAGDTLTVEIIPGALNILA